MRQTRRSPVRRTMDDDNKFSRDNDEDIFGHLNKSDGEEEKKEDSAQAQSFNR